MNQRKEENDRRNHFMINLHESMGPDRDRTRDPWICSQTRICSQTCYRLRYAARLKRIVSLRRLFKYPQLILCREECVNIISLHVSYSQTKNNEYAQEIPQSQTTDKPMAPQGRSIQPSQDTRKTNSAKQPALSSPSR